MQCKNCGADKGLHHHQTMQCPKGGVEETREGHKQVWIDTVFMIKEQDISELKEEISSLKSQLHSANEKLKSLSAKQFSESHVYTAINMARGVTFQTDREPRVHHTNKEIVEYLQSLPSPSEQTEGKQGEELKYSWKDIYRAVQNDRKELRQLGCFQVGQLPKIKVNIESISV